MKWQTTTFQTLESSRIFPEKIVKRLKELHIDTLEDLYALSTIDSVKKQIVSLHDDESEILNSFQAMTTVQLDSKILKWFESAALFSPEHMKFGSKEPSEAMIQETEQALGREADLDYMLADLDVSEINHIDQLPPVRFQGNRGTCVAFGSIAVREFFKRRTDRLSEQYLYWGAKMRDGNPENSGTWIRFAMECLEDEGACLDREWPYNKEITASEHQGSPPANVIQAAKRYRVPQTVPINPKSVNDLRSILLGNSRKKGRIISFSLPVFDSWYKNPITKITGRFPCPCPVKNTEAGTACVWWDSRTIRNGRAVVFLS